MSIRQTKGFLNLFFISFLHSGTNRLPVNGRPFCGYRSLLEERQHVLLWITYRLNVTFDTYGPNRLILRATWGLYVAQGWGPLVDNWLCIFSLTCFIHVGLYLLAAKGARLLWLRLEFTLGISLISPLPSPSWGIYVKDHWLCKEWWWICMI